MIVAERHKLLFVLLKDERRMIWDRALAKLIGCGAITGLSLHGLQLCQVLDPLGLVESLPFDCTSSSLVQTTLLRFVVRLLRSN
jgi:hypothetical protein